MDDRGPVSELDVGSTRAARLLRRGTMLILGALALCTAVPAMASATTQPGWELNELPLTESIATQWKGTVKLADPKTPIVGEESVECESTAEGTASIVGGGKVTSWTVSKCVAVKGCEKNIQDLTLRPLNLPWATEVVTVEGHERELIVNGGKGNPGFDLECKILGGKVDDECTGTLTTAVSNVTGGVSAVFNAAEKLTCHWGGANSGSVEGTQSIKASAGGTLHTAGGLSLGWMRNGSQITEKSPSTYYGTITLSDQLPSLGVVSVKCEDTGKGTVGAGVNGEMTSWTMSNCTSLTGCEANTASIEAVNLPWHTELVTVEGALNDTFKTTENGFRLKCKDAGTSVTDTCPVVPHARITNSERDVTATFSKEKFTCIGSKSGAGELQGSQTIELSTGGDLWGA